jgi:V/A-type H+-transporting ATPase subunit I
MAIVKMKRLRVMAMESDRQELMRQMLRLGCVEISEPEERLADPAWAALLKRGTSSLVRTKSAITDVDTALAAIQKYGKLKGGLFIKRHPISEKEFLGAETAKTAKAETDRICALLETLTRLQNEESRLAARRAGLLPWQSMELPLEQQGTEHTLLRPGTCPGAVDVGAVKTELAAADAAAELLEISGDKQQHYLLLICHKADEEAAMDVLRKHSFSAVSFQETTGTPTENLQKIDAQISENRKQQSETETALAGCAGAQDALRAYADRLTAEAMLETDSEYLMTDGTIAFFEGWVPAESLDKVSRLFEEKGCAWEATDPTPDEIADVPVKLKNNWLTKPLNMVTEMYSLPAYDNVDPNPLMAPFFILFYGIMLADMGYGLLMILASLIIGKKYAPKGTAGNLFGLMGLCGVSTFIMGILTGGFFGDFIPQLAKLINPNTTLTALPALFTPLNDTLMILIGSMCLGFVQINVGMLISFIEKLKKGQVMDAIWEEATWWVVFAGLALSILSGNSVVLILGGVMIIGGSIWGAKDAKGFGKVIGAFSGVFGSLYNHVTGYFGDILSYSRLMALMLAGSVIAQVFNTLGAIPGNIIVFLVISLVGNALNFALNLLGCYVHDLRLQCLEYFNKFYQDGGRPFTPLAMNTKYVDIEKD